MHTMQLNHSSTHNEHFNAYVVRKVLQSKVQTRHCRQHQCNVLWQTCLLKNVVQVFTRISRHTPRNTQQLTS